MRAAPADIGIITGLAEPGGARGVRRLEATTGKVARHSLNKQLELATARFF